MSEYKAVISWKRSSADYTYESYNRKHLWKFDGGAEVSASASPAYKGDADCVDPEEAFIAAISSCHMLTFLAIAAKKKLALDRYEDEAVGILEKGADGKLAITKVTLRPRVWFAGNKPAADEFEKMHHASHEACFIASSVKTEVAFEAEMAG